MNKLEILKEKARSIIPADKFESIDKWINSHPISNYKKAAMWKNFLSGEMMLDTWVEPEYLSDKEISKIEEDIKERGTDAILDIIDNQRMLPKNLKDLLRKKYSKELSEVKEIIHKRKYSIK